MFFPEMLCHTFTSKVLDQSSYLIYPLQTRFPLLFRQTIELVVGVIAANVKCLRSEMGCGLTKQQGVIYIVYNGKHHKVSIVKITLS